MENQRSIADINRMVRSIVEAETLGHFYSLSGKIESSFKSELGHIYFWLVDGPSRVNCIIFEELAGQLPFEIRNGENANELSAKAQTPANASLTARRFLLALFALVGNSTLQ